MYIEHLLTMCVCTSPTPYTLLTMCVYVTHPLHTNRRCYAWFSTTHLIKSYVQQCTHLDFFLQLSHLCQVGFILLLHFSSKLLSYNNHLGLVSIVFLHHFSLNSLLSAAISALRTLHFASISLLNSSLRAAISATRRCSIFLTMISTFTSIGCCWHSVCSCSVSRRRSDKSSGQRWLLREGNLKRNGEERQCSQDRDDYCKRGV